MTRDHEGGQAFQYTPAAASAVVLREARRWVRSRMFFEWDAMGQAVTPNDSHNYRQAAHRSTWAVELANWVVAQDLAEQYPAESTHDCRIAAGRIVDQVVDAAGQADEVRDIVFGQPGEDNADDEDRPEPMPQEIPRSYWAQAQWGEVGADRVRMRWDTGLTTGPGSWLEVEGRTGWRKVTGNPAGEADDATTVTIVAGGGPVSVTVTPEQAREIGLILTAAAHRAHLEHPLEPGLPDRRVSDAERLDRLATELRRHHHGQDPTA